MTLDAAALVAVLAAAVVTAQIKGGNFRNGHVEVAARCTRVRLRR